MGRIKEINGDRAFVGWESGVATWTPIGLLRRAAEQIEAPTETPADPLAIGGTLFYRYAGKLYGPIVVDLEDYEIRVKAGIARWGVHPLTTPGLSRAVDDAPELDPGDDQYALLLALPECGRVLGFGGVLVREPNHAT